MAHIHETKDAETHFIINATSREISNADELPALVQNDHNSERFTFVIPRYIDGHDMSICNKTQVHYLNIDSATKAQYADVYEVDDLHIDEADETKVVCTWLISRYATQYAGSLNFIIQYACEKDGVIDYAWNTAIFKGIIVKNGINNTALIMTEYTDILEKWKQEILEGVGQGGGGTGSGLTSQQAADLAANTEARHEHANKELLDNLKAMGSRDIVALFNDGTEPDRNLFVGGLALERFYRSIQSFYLTKKAFEEAITNGELGGTVESLPADKITYENENLVDQTGTVKAALDELISFATSTLPDLEAKKHEHSNNSILDKIGEADGKLTFDGEVIKGDPYTLTEDDKLELVTAVKDALPKYNGEVAEV